ncbi:MAG: hypothetical protein QXF82_07965 [Nitrososphaeria archaeon]
MPAGFYNGRTMFAENVSFDGTQNGGRVDTDGQLLIGSSDAPNIRKGFLESSDGSIAITNGSGTIDLSVTSSGITNVTATNAGKSISFATVGTTKNLVTTNANNNTLIGADTATNIFSGTGNTALGHFALNRANNVSGNIAIGANAGDQLINGNNNIFIGSNTSEIFAMESNKIRIGNSTDHNEAYFAGIAGVTTSNSEMVTIDTTTGQLGSTPAFQSEIMTAEITLTSAQIKNLYNTPIEVIPAQGAGTTIIPMHQAFKFIYGSEPFVAVNPLSLGMMINDSYIFVLAASSISETQSYTFWNSISGSNSLTYNTIENFPLMIAQNNATPITGNASNDTVITFSIKYYVVTI